MSTSASHSIAKTEQRFDIRRRCRSRPFYYIVKVQVEATSSKIGPEYCRIAAFVLIDPLKGRQEFLKLPLLLRVEESKAKGLTGNLKSTKE